MMKTPRFLLAACILLALALTFSCSDDDGDFLAKLPPEPEYCIDFVEGTKRLHFGVEKEQFCDKRDGNLYVKVKIGEQTWMAEDLSYNKYNSRCALRPQYNEEGEEIGCETNRLYDWYGAMGACPIGWRLPTDDDWNTLVNYVGASESAIKLKATSGWRDFDDQTNGNGTDDYGFSLLPGRTDQAYAGAEWWSATALDAYGVSFWRIVPYRDYHPELVRSGKDNMFSVRCLLGDDNGASEPYRDIDLVASRSTPVTDKRDGIYKEYKTVAITTKTGTLTWMAQNLNYAVEGSKCIISPDSLGREAVDENTPYCDTYGRLYNWTTAINVCPTGWRLPSRDEFASLGFNIIKLKATSGWDYQKRNGTDDYGLAFLPGGYALESTNGDGHLFFYGNKTNGGWWGRNESETNNSNAVSLTINHTSEYSGVGIRNKSTYLSIRCVKE
ncbi:MAG: hypothetical protein LBQ87_05345 [Candidatus Fibromonas sp.]|jgi:uncharacterized protein (TIGR02145 family)|nr:hypothetical protein [Candidatus Fibromonas sp.]